MSLVITDSKHYTDIADAIRTKVRGGVTYRPEDMAENIRNIQCLDFSNSIDLTTVFIDKDGSIYNGCGYKAGYRLNSSGGETALTDHYTTGFIAIEPNSNKLLLISGCITDYTIMYDATFAIVASEAGGIVSEDVAGDRIICMNEKALRSANGGITRAIFDKIKYVRFSCYKNPPIVKLLDMTDIIKP